MRALEKFDLAALAKIDGGRVAIAFEQALKRCAADCDDRPGEKKARTVTLSLAVEPRIDQDGMCEDVNITATVADSVPKRKSKAYNMSLRKGGNLAYHPESPDNHAQEVFDLQEH